jgi:hypothetical protein
LLIALRLLIAVSQYPLTLTYGMGLLRLLCALEQFKPHVSCACPPQSRRGQFPVTLQLFQPVLSALFDFEEGTSLFICCCPPRILPGGPDLLPKPGFFRIRPPVQSGIGRSLPAVNGSADTPDILVGEIAILSHVHQPLERLPVDLTARVQGLYLALDITRHVTLVEPAYVPIVVITMIVLSGLQPAPQSMPPTHTCLLWTIHSARHTSRRVLTLRNVGPAPLR